MATISARRIRRSHSDTTQAAMGNTSDHSEKCLFNAEPLVLEPSFHYFPDDLFLMSREGASPWRAPQRGERMHVEVDERTRNKPMVEVSELPPGSDAVGTQAEANVAAKDRRAYSETGK